MPHRAVSTHSKQYISMYCHLNAGVRRLSRQDLLTITWEPGTRHLIDRETEVHRA